MDLIIKISSMLATVLVFWLTKRLYRRWKTPWLNPLLISPILLILFLLSLHVPYEAYMGGAHWLTQLLQPATVAFAVPMYRYFSLLKKHVMEITTSILLGSTVSFLSSVFLADWMKLGSVAQSIAPRSITTPIAMDISQMIGGISTLTAVFVVLTAITSTFVGPLMTRLFPIRTPMAIGAMYGMGGNGTGTAKAFEIGDLEGTFSSVSMILAAGITLLLAPVFMAIL